MSGISKKKLLILVDWFTPGYKAGGPIQSCVNLSFALKNDYQIFVLTTDTDHGDTNPYQQINSNEWIRNEQLGVDIFYCKKQTFKPNQILQQIDIIKPDFVYLNHLFSPHFVIYPLWLKFTQKIAGKVIVAPRGALFNSALSLKSYKKKPLLFLYKKLGIHKLVTFHATNVREQKAIEEYFPGAEIIIADNLPDLNQSPFLSIKKEMGILNCIFIARIVPIKNLLFLLHAMSKSKSNINLTIVGPIENEKYWQECQRFIQTLPCIITVKYLGAKNKNDLKDLLIKNHLFALPTTGENFGHSIFESLLCGRPVLISDQTPWLNLKEQVAGWDLPLSDTQKFTAIMDEVAQYNQEHFDIMAKGSWEFAHNFINSSLAQQQYLKIFS